jgi:hypothetical protein
MEAQNAPTVAWKSTERVSTSFHRHSRHLEGDISIELRTGTFLSSLDRHRVAGLTAKGLT